MSSKNSTPAGSPPTNPTNNNNPSTPTPSSATKPRLTDVQKKANHIESEKKRRIAIREGFDALAEIVPGMQGQGRSEAVVLNATVECLREQLQKKEELRRVAREKGMGDKEFEAVYARVRKAGERAGAS